MRKIQGVADVETSLEKSKPELRVRVDRAARERPRRAAARSRTTLRAAVVGRGGVGDRGREGDSHDVRVRLRADQRRYARGPARADRAHRQGRRQRRQDPRAAARAGARRRRGTRPLDHPPQGPAREVRVSANPDGRSLGEITADIEAAAAQARAAAGLRHRARRRRGGAEGHVQRTCSRRCSWPSSSST